MYTIEYESEVRLFLNSLQASTTAKIARFVGLIIEHGPDLGMPRSRKINNKLYELRIRGTQEVRVFYACFGKTVVMLHGFLKKIQKIPRRELEIAYKHLVAYK